jgi:sugar lactone lactonase YvrE
MTSTIREVVHGLRFPEGPIVLPDGSILVAEIAAGRLSRILPAGGTEVVATCPTLFPLCSVLTPALRLRQRTSGALGKLLHVPRHRNPPNLRPRPNVTLELDQVWLVQRSD